MRMDIVAHESSAVCRVLEEDGDLADVIPGGRRVEAFEECQAETVVVGPGRWAGIAERWPEDWVGLLVLRGLLLRRVGVAGRFGAELLGSGDLLRPCQRESDLPLVALSTSFQVLEPTRMAVLDGRFALMLGRHPELTARLVERALRRSRNLAVNMAIVHQARVDVRLRMLFWHLAARWGRVRGGSVLLPLRITHDVLADLAAAQRPTVSSALALLAKEGYVRSDKSGWLLLGDPPGELLDLGAAPPLGGPLAPPLEAPLASPVGDPLASPVGDPLASPVGDPLASPVVARMKPPIGGSLGSPLSDPLSRLRSRPA
jgi:CRP/FNR family transcriptional regulator, cyclic AMP receptor protein